MISSAVSRSDRCTQTEPVELNSSQAYSSLYSDVATMQLSSPNSSRLKFEFQLACRNVTIFQFLTGFVTFCCQIIILMSGEEEFSWFGFPGVGTAFIIFGAIGYKGTSDELPFEAGIKWITVYIFGNYGMFLYTLCSIVHFTYTLNEYTYSNVFFQVLQFVVWIIIYLFAVSKSKSYRSELRRMIAAQHTVVEPTDNLYQEFPIEAV